MRRLADIATERERWSARLQRAGERVAELKERLAALDAEIAAVPDDPALFEDRRRALARRAEAAEADVAAAQQGLAAAEAEHRAAQEVARAALDALAEARELRGRDEERVIAAAARKTELAAQIAEHFDVAARRAARACRPRRPTRDCRKRAPSSRGSTSSRPSASGSAASTCAPRRRRAELETRLGEMRRRAGGSGGGDQAPSPRHPEPEPRGPRSACVAAFETVNGHFVSLFQHLFGGGTAELALTGSDDPLEAGLEIIARPPGKRPQSMTLLSGGEQALTALALIFAVFLTNPSPICVLDEVDAPLDDANVERFCKLLDDMRQRTETRFVVVTHNPITMAQMDRLLGVTMAERGVSQVVSVDLAGGGAFPRGELTRYRSTLWARKLKYYQTVARSRSP